jgi:hypothetical protein
MKRVRTVDARHEGEAGQVLGSPRKRRKSGRARRRLCSCRPSRLANTSASCTTPDERHRAVVVEMRERADTGVDSRSPVMVVSRYW